MIELVAENGVLRILLLLFLFAVVAAIVYFAAQSIGARNVTRGWPPAWRRNSAW